MEVLSKFIVGQEPLKGKWMMSGKKIHLYSRYIELRKN